MRGSFACGLTGMLNCKHEGSSQSLPRGGLFATEEEVMKTIDSFWKAVREPREAREKIESGKRREEFENALRAHTCVVILGRRLNMSPELIAYLQKETRVIDLTTLPPDEPVLKAAVGGAFPEMGRLLVLTLKEYNIA